MLFLVILEIIIKSITLGLSSTMDIQPDLIVNPTTVDPEDDDNIFYRLMGRVGYTGKYQIITFVIWGIISVLGGGVLLITAFIFFQDPYQCTQPFPGDSCLDYVCSLPESERQAFVPAPTIRSLANKFGDYRCGSQLQYLTLVQTVMYLGNLVALVLMTLFGNMISKKTLVLLNLAAFILGLLLTILAVSLMMGGIGLFLCTFGASVTLQICYMYIMQTASFKYRQGIIASMSTLFSLGALVNVLWFYLLPNFQEVLIFFYLIPLVIVTIGFLLFVKDTPICMVSKLKAHKAHRGLKFIAQLNKKEDFDLTVQQMQQLQNTYRQQLAQQSKNVFSLIDLFRYKSLRMLTLMLIVIFSTVNMIYYAPSLMIAQFNLSIYINGVVVSSSQVIAGAVSMYLILNCRRRFIAFVTFAVVLGCSTALIFLWDQSQETASSTGSNIAVLVLLFTMELALTIEYNSSLVYMNQLYPTQMRIIGLGFVNIFGAIIVLVNPEIINACLSSGFRIMIIFAILAGLSIICSYVLPQTFGTTLRDIILQLANVPPSESSAKSVLVVSS